MFFNYVCELKTTSNMAGTMVFGDLLQNCVNQRLFETYNAPARGSTLNAHYTSPVVIRAMYGAFPASLHGQQCQPDCQKSERGRRNRQDGHSRREQKTRADA